MIRAACVIDEGIVVQFACDWWASAERSGVVVTRPSRIECVEKHMVAVSALISEHRDCYPHRLRAIGHLHEAEDES